MKELLWWLAGLLTPVLAICAAMLAQSRRQARELEALRRRNALIEAANAERAAAQRAAMANRERCAGCGLPRQMGDDGVCRICQYRAALDAYRAVQAPICVRCAQPIPIDSQTHYCGRCLRNLLASTQPPAPPPEPEFADVDVLLKRSGL